MKLCVSILLLTKRFLLLVIYAVFFAVQFFFNFRWDNINQISSSAPYDHVETNKQKKLEVAKSDNNRRCSIRLNKRFQPTIVPTMAYAGEQIPVKYLNRNNTNKPDDYLLISFILATSLRGPPALS